MKFYAVFITFCSLPEVYGDVISGTSVDEAAEKLSVQNLVILRHAVLRSKINERTNNGVRSLWHYAKRYTGVSLKNHNVKVEAADA